MSGLSKEDIKIVFKKGRRLSSDKFIVYFLPSQELKISPVVSKKISKKAVVRNKIKRRIRHMAFEVLKNGSFAIVAKKNISEYNFEILKKEFQKLANKIN